MKEGLKLGPLTDSEKQLIIQLKESGAILKEIAATTNRNPITIRKYLLSQGYSLSRPRLSDEEQETIISLFESGLSCKKIAQLVNRSPNGVNHFLSSKGYDTSSAFVITEEEKKIAIETFLTTNNCAEAARTIGHSHDGVWSMLKREGFDTRNSVYAWLDDEQVAMIRSMYLTGHTAAEILPLLGGKIICENTIMKIVKDGGLAPRGTGYRNVILHEDFFDVVDTEEKAYVVGFLMADGYVIEKHGKSPIWGITLQAQDKYMLEKFNELVGSDNKIVYSRGEYMLTITSRHMVDELAKYNIVPRKCKKISFPTEVIPCHLRRHAIRGLFDGDGCISGQACTFYGNELMIADVRSILHEAIGVKWNKLHTNKDSGVISFSFFSKRDVSSFYHYLYDDASIYLTRKKARFEKLPFICTQVA